MRPTRFFSYTLTGLLACLPALFPRTAQAEEPPRDLPIVVDVDAVADAAEGLDEDDVEEVVAKPKPKRSKLQSKKSAKPKKATKSSSKAKPKKTAQQKPKKSTKSASPKVATTAKKKDVSAPKKVASTPKKSKPLALSKPSKVEASKDDAEVVSEHPKPAKKMNKKQRRPLKRRMKQS